MSERDDLLLEFMRIAAQHSGVRGDSLSEVLRAAATCLTTGTGAPEIAFVPEPVTGDDLLLVHETDLLSALEAAGIPVVAGAIADDQRADAAILSEPVAGPSEVVVDDGGALLTPLRGVTGSLGTLRSSAPAAGWQQDQLQFAARLVEQLGTTVERHWIEQQHLDRLEALREAQRHTHVGSFEWDVVTDKVRWSDELFRIYGNEPQSFEPTFEEFLGRIHEDDRESVRASVYQAYEERSDYRIEERILRPDGTIRLLSSWGHVIVDENRIPIKILGSCQDVTELRATMQELNQTERRLLAVEERRSQALELNDNVVQGLATAIYALQLGQSALASNALNGTLVAARSIISDLLTGDDTLDPASLVRSSAARSFIDAAPRTDPGEPEQAHAARVVIADDSDDIRLLTSMMLSAEPDFEVVAEATNGIEVVALAGAHQPDIVLLDLAMPRLDGLGAIPQILTASPHTTIVVFSGFHAGAAERDALSRGAHAYIEKGLTDTALPDRLRKIQARRASDQPADHEPANPSDA